ncbi:hypothetical protein QUF55_10395, partial [Clostridiaceae bacterium HSG29]|nr:hypothetical protein [Clostridiaceae bacterium HSG29]
MATKKILTDTKVKKAIEGTAGVILSVAKRCGASYNATWRYFNEPKNAHMKKLLEQEREKIIDLAENKLYKKVNDEEWHAIKFVLTTIGAKRGFTEKQEINHNITKIEIEE